MASLQFLCATDLSADVPVIGEGLTVVNEHERLRDFLESQETGLSLLFAEPAFGAKTPTGYRNASWYTPLEGKAVAYADLPEAARPAVAQRLAEQMAAVARHFDAPGVGPLLRHALAVPSLDSVLVVGNHCVLIKWGMVPARQAQSAEALDRHFGATLGTLAGFAGLAALVPSVAAAAPPSEPPPPEPPPEPAITAAVPPVVEAAAPLPPPPSAPPLPIAAPGGTSAPSRTGLIAALVVMGLLVLAILIALVWWFAPRSWWGGTPAITDQDRRALEDGLLSALQAERDRLRGLLDGDVCAIPPSEIPNRALQLPPRSRPGDSTAPVDPAAKGDAKPSEAAKASSLNDYLERSTVLVMTDSAMGSGFFVDDRHLVTNRHVVELEKGGTAEKIVVTSKALGGLLRGKVLLTTQKSEIGDRDYAILELIDTPANAPIPLPLARGVEKRATVVAAGFPGYLVMQDPAMVKLKEGDASAAPEMVLSEGKVQVIHSRDGAPPIIIHSADISQGNSGGPLVDECGRLVGINTFIGLDEESGRRGLFSLGSADLIAFLTQNKIAVRVDEAACSPAPGVEAKP